MSSREFSAIASGFSLRKLFLVVAVVAMAMSLYHSSSLTFLAGMVSAAAMSGAILMTRRGKNLEVALRFSLGLVGALVGVLAGAVVYVLLGQASELALLPLSNRAVLLVVLSSMVGFSLAWRLSGFLAARAIRPAESETGWARPAVGSSDLIGSAADRPAGIAARRIPVGAMVFVLCFAPVVVVGGATSWPWYREYRAKAAIVRVHELGGDLGFVVHRRPKFVPPQPLHIKFSTLYHGR